MAKTMYEICEMTELEKQVYEIVEDGLPQGKFVIVEVHEWEEFERYRIERQRQAEAQREKWATIPNGIFEHDPAGGER